MEIKGVKIGFKHVAYAALLVLCLLLWNECNRTDELEARAERAEANIEALNDSLREEKDRNGNLVYRKRELQSTVDQLKDLNGDLHEKVTSLRKEVEQATDMEFRIKRDTLTVESEVDSTYAHRGKYGIEWEFDSTYAGANYRRLAGVSEFRIDTTGLVTPLNTRITEDVIGVELFTGVNRTDDGDREIFVRSKHPGFEVKKLNGANLGPPPEKDGKGDLFVVGPYMGAGVNTKGRVYPSVGMAVVFNLNRQYKAAREKLTGK